MTREAHIYREIDFISLFLQLASCVFDRKKYAEQISAGDNSTNIRQI
jgi:hypothetical protein